jgi:lipopolysaccharide export system ATP-binding protein
LGPSRVGKSVLLDRLSSFIPRRAASTEAGPREGRVADAASAAPNGADPASGVPAPQFSLMARDGFLTIEGLEKSFGGRKVVEHVSLELMRGEAVGLLGPNGAGKTTVFYMITGLLAPDAGHIYLDGHDVTQLPMYRRSRLGVGYLPQEASIFRGLNVEDNVRAVL